MCEAWEPLPAALCLHDTTIINVEDRNKTLILKVTVSFKYPLNYGIRRVRIWTMEIHFSRKKILNSDPIWNNVIWWRQLTNHCEILKVNAWYSVVMYVGKSVFLVVTNRSRMWLRQYRYCSVRPPLPKLSQLTSSGGVVVTVTTQQSGRSGL